MKESILVEFIAPLKERQKLIETVISAAPNFIKENGVTDINNFVVISGKMNSEEASVLKLQNAFLADRMKIYYIPDELKNKYRNR